MSASRPPRRQELQSVAVLATLGALIFPILLAGPAIAGEKGPKPGTFRGGSLVQDGWWARSNEPPPETGLLQPPSVPAVAAPAGTLPVTLVNGEPERIAALEFGLKGGADTIVTEVLLVMAESEERGANINADMASLQACPVTESFWVGVDNGAWKTAPLYDCEAGVAPGVRDKSGTWTFDLTALAAQWTASERTNSPAVVLVGAPAVDPTQGSPSFQVAFDGDNGIGLAAKVTDMPPEGGDLDGEEPSGTDSSSNGSGPDEVPTGGSSGGFSSGGSGGGSLGPIEVGPLSSPDSSAVEGAGGDDPALPGTGFVPETSVDAAPQSLVSAAATSPWYSGLGVRSLALVVVAIMLAYLVMVAMGGAGQPVVGGQRRGVGRALERLRATRAPGFARIAVPGMTPSSKSSSNPIITLEDRT